jgi:hypothetical protein
MPETTDDIISRATDRYVAQRQTTAALDAVLERAGRDLPTLAWTVGAGHRSLVGRAEEAVLSAAHQRAAVHAWAAHLGLPAPREHAPRAGARCVRAHGHIDHGAARVQVLVIADIYETNDA